MGSNSKRNKIWIINEASMAVHIFKIHITFPGDDSKDVIEPIPDLKTTYLVSKLRVDQLVVELDVEGRIWSNIRLDITRPGSNFLYSQIFTPADFVTPSVEISPTHIVVPQAEYDKILFTLIRQDPDVLEIPGVYDPIARHYNDQVLDVYKKHKEAFPDETSKL